MSTLFDSNFKKILFGFLLTIALLAAWSTQFWRSPDHYAVAQSYALPAPILTNQQYGKHIDTHPRPYIVSIETANGGALVLYGAEHTQDPADPQIEDILSRWQAFEPTVALIEGRVGFFIEGFQNPVVEYGESGWVFYLARQDNIHTYTWEAPLADEISFTLQAFPAEQVALFYTLRPYFSNLRFGRPADPDAVAQQYIQERSQYPGIENLILSVEQIDKIWQRDFPNQPDWRDTSDQFGLPGYLSDIAELSGQARDAHFIQVLIDLVHNGERVFAVAGSSHAVKLDAALHAALAQ